MAKDICHNCGFHQFEKVFFSDRLSYRGSFYEIEYEAMQCQQCDEAFLTGRQSQAVTSKLINSWREDKGLLFGDELLRIRKKINYTQARMEKLLGTGRNTVIKWEKNLSSQNISIDRDYRILDLIDEDPEFVLKMFPNLILPEQYEVSEVHLEMQLASSDYDIRCDLEKPKMPLGGIGAKPIAA